MAPDPRATTERAAVRACADRTHPRRIRTKHAWLCGCALFFTGCNLAGQVRPAAEPNLRATLAAEQTPDGDGDALKLRSQDLRDEGVPSAPPPPQAQGEAPPVTTANGDARREHNEPPLRPATVSGCHGWTIVPQGKDIVAFVYGPDHLQLGAIHEDSSYVRFTPSQSSGWGTSLVLAPSFWKSGTYYQATRIKTSFSAGCEQLRMSFEGAIGGLDFRGELVVRAPRAGELHGEVEITTSGPLPTDDRIGESFKLAMLSSMHISDTHWDASAAIIGDAHVPIPTARWVTPTPVRAHRFGLLGGSSVWKARAPTVVIETSPELDAQVAGWVTTSSDPNDDNLGMWMTVRQAVPRFSYTFHIVPGA